MQLKLFLCGLTALFCGACSSGPTPIQAKADHFLLTNINIVDPETHQVWADKQVYVRDGKIVSVTDQRSDKAIVPPNIIDGQNGYLTPGLIDMHVHMFESGAFALTLSHGVTHVRIMGGVAAQLTWRDQINKGALTGSSATVSSPVLSGYKDALLHHGVFSEQQGRDAVTEYHRQGYDIIKAYGSLNESALTGIIAQAAALQMPVAKHGPHGSGNMPIASLRGLQSLEHVEDIFQGPLNFKFNPKRLPNIIDQLKAIDVPIAPTLSVFEQLTRLSVEKESYLEAVPQEYTSTLVAWEAKGNQVKRWLDASPKLAKHNQRTFDFLLHITQKLHQKGITLLTGSDSGALLTPHGLATHNELALLVRAGLSHYEALAAATINPAKALKKADQMGRIAPGYQADFIYTRHNPIEDLGVLKEPDAVTKWGKWYDKRSLQAMRTQAIEGRSFWSELKILLAEM